MKLASDDETLAENKVLILYALNKANKPLTNDVLYKIVLAAANMNYFYFQQFMLDLIEVGYICSFQKEDGNVLPSENSGAAAGTSENLTDGRTITRDKFEMVGKNIPNFN